MAMLIFFIIAGVMGGAGGLIGWFSYRSSLAAVLWSALASVVSFLIVLLIYGNTQPISSVGAIIQLTAYWIVPFTLAFFLPSVVCAFLMLLVRRAAASAIMIIHDQRVKSARKRMKRDESGTGAN